MNWNHLIDPLLEKPLYVVDWLPAQVPPGDEGAFSQVESFWLEGREYRRLYRKFFRILLKLNCYYDLKVSFGKKNLVNPSPEKLAGWIRRCTGKEKDYMNIFLDQDQTMIILNGDDLCLGVYGPGERLRELLSQLARGEGLFFWQTQYPPNPIPQES